MKSDDFIAKKPHLSVCIRRCKSPDQGEGIRSGMMEVDIEVDVEVDVHRASSCGILIHNPQSINRTINYLRITRSDQSAPKIAFPEAQEEGKSLHLDEEERQHQLYNFEENKSPPGPVCCYDRTPMALIRTLGMQTRSPEFCTKEVKEEEEPRENFRGIKFAWAPQPKVEVEGYENPFSSPLFRPSHSRIPTKHLSDQQSPREAAKRGRTPHEFSPPKKGGGSGKIFKLFRKEKNENDEFSKEVKRRQRLQTKTFKKARGYSMSCDSTFSEHFQTSSLATSQKKAYTYYAESISDLPLDLHESIKRMRISRRTLEQQFEVLLNILSFADKHIPRRRFVTHRQMEVLRQNQAHWSTNLTERVLLDPEDIFEQFTFSEGKALFKWDVFLGHGGFGQVVRAKCGDREDVLYGEQVALKFQKNDEPQSQRRNLEEVSLLKKCHHPNIVRLHRVLEVRSEVWMVMEFLSGGNLRTVGACTRYRFTEREIALVARETLQAIQYLHINQIAHRDLKDQNLMLTLTGEVKLIDFGLAIDLSAGPRVQMVGSPLWISPEMIRGEPHSYPVDVWSLVLCLLEMANQKPREVGNVKRAMFYTGTIGLVQTLLEPERWSDLFHNFIKQAANPCQHRRPKASELLRHKFISSACGRKALGEKVSKKLNVE